MHASFYLQEKRAENLRIQQEKEEEARRKAKEQLKVDGKTLMTELRNKQRKDRRAVESKDGAIEDNITCKYYIISNFLATISYFLLNYLPFSIILQLFTSIANF